MGKNEKNLDWIQLLRGVAALLVVLTHARYALLNTDGFPLAEQMFRPGATGVDLFFMISGFIMFYSTVNSDGSLAYAAGFAIKRFARVWPVYAVASVASAYLLGGGINYFLSPNGQFILSRSLLMVPVDPHHAPYFGLTLPVGWTLEFEMYFYLIFAVSLLFRRLRWVALASWALLSVIVLPYAQRGLDMSVTQDLGYPVDYMNIVTSPFVLEFLVGALIGWLYLQKWARIPNRTVAWHVLGLGVAFELWCVYAGVKTDHGPLNWGIPVALMVLSIAIASKSIEIRVPRLFVWLGSISYSLYLTHVITQEVFKQYLAQHGLEPLAHTWSFMFISTALAIPVAALSNALLEQGLSNIVRRWMLKLLPAGAGKPAARLVEAEPQSRRA